MCILNEGPEVIRPKVNGTQILFRNRRLARPCSFAVVTLLCLALLALVAVVQIAHVHSVATDADHCPLCVVLHSAAPVAVGAVLIVLVQIRGAAPLFEVRTTTWQGRPQFFIRPPPSDCRASSRIFKLA
jgi:hypothetical protein